MLLLFYNIAHIGDSFEIQQIMQNIIRCNPEKNIKFYLPYNHFIMNDVSGNLLFKGEDYTNPHTVELSNWLQHNFYGQPVTNYRKVNYPNNNEKSNIVFQPQNIINPNLPNYINQHTVELSKWLEHTFYQQPLINYRKVNFPIGDGEFMIINTCLMRLHRFKEVTEMDPISFQEAYSIQLDEIRQTYGIDIKYNKLTTAELLPRIPDTNIDLFHKWKANIQEPVLFYLNYLPKSGQKIPCTTDEDHERVILHIAAVNPNLIILVPKFTEKFRRKKNIISCEELFDYKESKSCENLYKMNKILCQCEYSVHYDIGASMTYMNTDFFLAKNKLFHVNTPRYLYFKTISSFLEKIGSTKNLIDVKCTTTDDVINYFDTPLISEWIQIQRKQGYGASFNNLYLRDAMIKKEAKNEYGVKKIQKEIIFYKFVQEHKCCPVTEFIESTDTSYTMKYLPKHIPLFQVFPFFTETKKTDILQKIDSHLQQLHETEIKFVSKEHYKKALQTEMFEKLEKRYEEVKEILSEYAFIKTVNSVPIRTFHENLDRLQKALNDFIKTQIYFKFNPIHGDCQFNNILYHEETDDLVFIDPRGYFGDNDLYGLAEYDFAKVLFALSGYDAFDAREVTGLDISDHNIMLEIPTLVPEPLAQTKNRFLSQLVVSIWMGNAHCFKENKFKTAYSYFIAMYYASLYL